MEPQNLFTSNFKRFFLKIVVPLIFLVFAIGYCFQYFFERRIILNSEINGSYKINRIIDATYKNEIPIFGSSRAENSFVPDILGKNYFNYGISGIQDDVVLFFLKEECKKNKKTPIIINFDLDGLNYAIGDISNYIFNSDYKPIKLLIGSNYKFVFKIPFFKYYGNYEYYFKMFLNNRINLTTKTNKGANLELNVITKNRFDELVEQRNASTSNFKNDNYLELNFINLITTNKARKFIVVISPYHKSYFHNFINYNEALSFFYKLNKISNIKVFDFSHVSYPDSLFLNTTHLNYYGAVRFSEELRDSIKKINPY